HPSYVEGQMQGGVVQGIGWALNEEYVYNEAGQMVNASYLDYRMPTSLDLPMIDTLIVEVPNPGHPYGVRGVGEVPIVPPPAALANAIYRAVGVRLTELPMSPGRVVKAILAKAGRPRGGEVGCPLAPYSFGLRPRLLLRCPGRTFLLQLRQECIYGLIHRFPADVLEADDALGVEDVDRRPAPHAILPGDGAAGAAVEP